MANFTRTITDTTIHPALMEFENGKAKTTPLDSFTVHGELVKDEKAHKMATKAFKAEEKARKEKEGEKFVARKGQLVVTNVEYSEKLYGMTVEKFMEVAEFMGDYTTDKEGKRILEPVKKVEQEQPEIK